MNNLQHIDEYALQSISKKEVKAKAQEEAEMLIESGKDVTPVYVQANRVIEYATTYCNALKDKVVMERELYPKQEKIRVLGAEVTVAEAGVRYDFSRCQDKEWSKLKEAAELANEALKLREDMLKTITKPLENQLCPDSGEVYTIYPPLRKSTTAPRIQY